MSIKKIVAFVMAALMVVLLVSCEKTPSPEQSSSTESTPLETTSSETASLENTTASTEPSETTEGTDTSETTASGGGEEIPDPQKEIPDIERLEIGNYVTLVYNAAACDVEYEVEKGLGSRQTVTLTAKMKDGFLFDGWSSGNALANTTDWKNQAILESANQTYRFEVSSSKTIYLNCSMTLVYHANGGSLASGVSSKETYSLVFYHNPNTRPEMGYFVRDGYTLVGYNTEADGSGEFVSLGAKVNANGDATIDLYCIWAENTPEDSFTYKTSGSSVTITGYTGDEDVVVIPQTLGGKKVTKIAEGAFTQKSVKTVVIAKTVEQIEAYAFDRCENLTTVILFDTSFGTSAGISENSFSQCENLKNIRINTSYTLTDTWQSYGAAKLDRLIWAADKKKIIIIGGSGAYYGYNSQILKDALDGEYEIINFGENANISALLYFDIVEDFIREGDIVLWSPEPGEYTLGRTDCGNRFWDFRKSDYDFLKYVDISLYTDLLPTFASYCATLRTSNFKEFDALTTSVNQYGDDISSRQWNGQRFEYWFKYSLQAPDELAELVSKISEKGGSVYFSFAAMQESGMSNIKEDDVLAFEEMLEEIPGIVSISDYQDCIYDDDMFYDSAWHMTAEGAQARSEQVASDILAQLQKESNS